MGKQSGLASGIYSAASTRPQTSTTADHLFGATEIGKYIHQAFIKYHLNIDYMVETWLYEHLFLWMTIKVSKAEHTTDNIARDEHTLEQIMSLEHYRGVSILIYDQPKTK